MSKKIAFSFGSTETKKPNISSKNSFFLKKAKNAEKDKADEETQKVYESFVKSFEVSEEDKSGKKVFMRGGSLNPNTLEHANGKTADKLYKPKPIFEAFSPSKPTPKIASPVKVDSQPDKQYSIPPPIRKGEKKKRNIDTFLEELKAESQVRQAREEAEKKAKESGIMPLPMLRPTPGSRDGGDPETTNIYLGNLSPQVSEELLLKDFGLYGPIASVKIMWPRSEEEKARQRNCGFVSFMEREHAEQAIKYLDDFDMLGDGYPIKVGWGKRIQKPSAPIFVHPEWQETQGIPAGADQIFVKFPSDIAHSDLIDETASLVAANGKEFEFYIAQRERYNKHFQFIFASNTDEFNFYHWRLFSLTRGESLTQWNAEPLQMVPQGPFWVPPIVPEWLQLRIDKGKPKEETTKGNKHDADREREHKRKRRKKVLPEEELAKFEDMLRDITLERGTVLAVMAFALDNAEYADDIAEIVMEALTLTETPLAKKLARLYALSDILYNTSAMVKNSSAYRGAFQERLEPIMQSFKTKYESIDSRLTAEALLERVLSLVRLWERWAIFPERFTKSLRAIFADRRKDEAIDGQPLPATNPPSRPGPGFAPVANTAASANTLTSLGSDDEDIDGFSLPPPTTSGTYTLPPSGRENIEAEKARLLKQLSQRQQISSVLGPQYSEEADDIDGVPLS
eukprot:GCRY01001117.1.p1 GENE.GCRY01001117.1~~GCRY01001117.1.p1  ORF type:complete len:682 (+),score=169.84 GCRY01001117.1:272-2317(+)